MALHPVILCGGSGTRLWPMSRAALPKQFLSLVSDRTMLQETVTRLSGLPDLAPSVLICNEEHRFLVAEQLREIKQTPAAILLEPVGRNTAPAVTLAALALVARDPDALMLVLPADHVIRDVAAFHAATAVAVQAAKSDRLVTFGIRPDRPHTGYGYIKLGTALELEGCHQVDRFVEKPDSATAEAFLAAGDHLWNSGMFVFKASRYLEEIARFQPAMLQICRQAIAAAVQDLDFCRIPAETFTTCPSDSIDYAVMEKTDAAVVVPVNLGWSDVGSWQALWEVAGKDGAGNVTRGDVYLEAVQNSYVRADSKMVAVIGLDDVVVVETADAVLVSHKDCAQNVKNVVSRLNAQSRTESTFHRRVYRPWGSYEGIDAGPRYQVKRITVQPGQKLSLQMHHHRAEHWVVVSGTARVTCDSESKLLAENQSTYIPLGASHRLENPGKLPLEIIEVQSGAYLGEDDIVRFEDVYHRDQP
ncbi:mannose-1-phosphate guanylyltransferase/mannose-6-phosphate isomerase [Chitinivorax tropicus]|uniref:mannose-1-phosphate guanylyltransferase n=1 Tax=Chitinivorax tropicus TaxID=714531 RepID=A0A840ML43_9PROT|nr:mannose-1-phosphate guanylyltransferase/mannose-6-phosphate isomerase [Chitinivorax tropicus]MBB5019884.1 mannose-1-phosphate guanylyltransferase/mannose-6-phosphate isomerase [Chitinivorax tropicus]